MDARLQEKATKAGVRTGGRTDAQTFDGLDLPAFGSEIRAQDQKPVHFLSQGGDQLGTFPVGEGRQRRVGGTRHEIQLAVTQGLHGFGHREEQIHFFCVETFGLEEAQLHRSNDGKVRVRYEIGCGNAHSVTFQPPAR